MRLNVEIKKDIYDELSEHASREGRSISDVIRNLVLRWNVKKRREEMQSLRAQKNDEVSDD